MHLILYDCFTTQLLEAMSGKTDVVECAFVKSDVTKAAYFATPVRLGKEGMAENLGMGELSSFEKKKLEEVTSDFFVFCFWCFSSLFQVLPELMKNIKKGEEFVKWH